MRSKKDSPDTIKDKKVSRRGLLTGAGKIAAGMVAASAGGINLISEAGASQGKPGTHERTGKFPWGYKKIDPARAGEIAYEHWYKHYCCYGAASGILLPLQEDIGEPFTLFPLESTAWGHGGAVGWGGLCGSLTGAGIATGLIAGAEGEHILNDVIAWYAETKLPLYKPENPKAGIKNINKSNSALCHISVGRWMRKEGVTFLSQKRFERCARITADVAMKTVTLLNQWADGKYKVTRKYQNEMYRMPTDNKCRQCHGQQIPEVPRRSRKK